MMKKYEDYSALMDAFKVQEDLFSETGKELSALQRAFKALEGKNTKELINVTDYYVANILTDKQFGCAKPERKAENTDELSRTLLSIENQSKDYNSIKTDLNDRDYKFEPIKVIVDGIISNIDEALEDLNAAEDRAKDVLNGKDVELYIESKQEENKEEYSVEPIKEDAEKVEEVENVNREDFKIEEFNLSDLKDKEDDEFENVEIKTDSIVDEDKKDNDFEFSIDDFVNSFGTESNETSIEEDEKAIDQNMNDLHSDVEDLRKASEELDNLFPVFDVQEDKLNVVEDDEVEIKDAHNDYKVDEAELEKQGWYKVIDQRLASEGLQDEEVNEDAKSYSRVA